MKNLFDNFEFKYLPLYIVMIILIGCMIYFSQKHIREGVKEVKTKEKAKEKSIALKKANSKGQQTT
jgi:uncharacterized membrane protein